MDLFFTLKTLGLSGIHAGAATTHDGVRVWLGEEDEKVASALVRTLPDAAYWLAWQAPLYYPRSEYAKVRRFIAGLGYPANAGMLQKGNNEER